MRPFLVIVTLFCAQAALTARAADEFPYTAYVQSNDVFVRSGPGASYYATDKVGRGDTVEVYRHDPGGWCAVRPPRGSFSWVASRHVKLTDNKLGEVTGDGVVVRVGSNLSDLRDVTQVRLDHGEEVDVLNAPRDRDGTPSDAWWRIAPPSGEFRWISERDISKDPPALEVPSINESTTDRRPDSASSTKGIDSKRTDSGELPNNQQTGWTAAGEKPSPPTMFTADAFRRELADIDLSLSAMVAKDPSAWHFDDLLARCDSALERAPTPEDKAKVRELHNKITKFDDLARRHKALEEHKTAKGKDSALSAAPRTALVPSAGPAPGPALGTASATPLAASKTPAVDKDNTSEFDGVGRLTRVVSKKTGAPTFALVSPNGDIVTFVSPAPGVSLYGYAGQEVGLNGQRGFSTELNKPFLTAQRVTVIK